VFQIGFPSSTNFPGFLIHFYLFSHAGNEFWEFQNWKACYWTGTSYQSLCRRTSRSYWIAWVAAPSDRFAVYKVASRLLFPVWMLRPLSSVRDWHHHHLLRTADHRSPILPSAQVARAAVPQYGAHAATGLLLGWMPPPRLRFLPSWAPLSPLLVQPPHIAPFPSPQVTVALPSPSSSRAR
jgi:hypothetical protein